MDAIVRHWPIAGLVVRTPRLELRWPDDDDLVALADVAAEGIHDADFMPFGIPWSRAPVGEIERNLIQYHWLQRARWTPESWSWNPVVVIDGEVVGTQGVSAEQFAIRRTVSTGSWIGRRFQGHGIGTEMRSAVLHLCFDRLGAQRAETSADEGNPASLTVTRKLGYHPNGEALGVIEGRLRRELCFVLPRDEWAKRRRDDIRIEGFDDCLELFGAADQVVGPA
jgi:RimJ/RimL family protein N-acetyltransferase